MTRAPVDHEEIKRLAKEGFSRRAIATMVGCHYNTVHYILNPDAYNRHLDKNIERRRAKKEDHHAAT